MLSTGRAGKKRDHSRAQEGSPGQRAGRLARGAGVLAFPTMLRAAIALCLLAQVAHAAEPSLKVPFQRYRMPNGLTVILYESHRLPTVVVDLWFGVGSKEEPARRTGFAHLFEHLMFMGTRAVPNGQFDTIMETHGGHNNASTSEDRTNYFEEGPSNLLETFLWLEADRLRTLPDDMTKQKVDLQREVVKNERRQSYENRPYGKVDLILQDKLFPPGHPYHHPVIGSHADLSAASVKDVKAFFRTWYVPSNASLVIAGDFDPKEARRLVDKYFGDMPRVPAPPRVQPPPARLKGPVRVAVTDAVELPRVTLAWHAPAHLQPGSSACELLSALLGGGKSSRLQRALVYDQKIAQEVQVEYAPMQFGGLFMVNATAQPGHTTAELERAIDAQLEALRKAPPAEREVERARAFTQTRALQRIDPLFGLADMLNEYAFYRDDPGELERSYLSRYGAVDAGDLSFAAAEVLGRPRLTVTVQPKKKEVRRGR